MTERNNWKELEAEANRLLGEEPLERGSFIEHDVGRFTGGAHLRRPTSFVRAVEYRAPKHPRGYACGGCGKPRSYGSAQLCRACYLQGACDEYASRVSAQQWLIDHSRVARTIFSEHLNFEDGQIDGMVVVAPDEQDDEVTAHS